MWGTGRRLTQFERQSPAVRLHCGAMGTHHRIQLLERRVKVLTVLVILMPAACFIVTLRAQGGATDNLRGRQITVVDAKGTERVWIGAPVPDPIVQEEKAQAVFQQPPATR